MKSKKGGTVMENLLYTPKLPEGFDPENCNVDEWIRMTEENQEKIEELDQKAKEQGSVLYRFLYEPVGDGFGIYQIIKVNKKTCQVRYCTTDGFDSYQVRQWGEKATIPMQYVMETLTMRDYWDGLCKKKIEALSED